MSLLVTGACGSLGRAILKAALFSGPERIVAYDQDELGTYLTRERLGQPPAIRWLIGDVCDRDRLERAMAGVETVIHCAARKWVASGIANIDELVRVNVGGTMAVVEAARRVGVQRALVITSDKGVEPTTSYGATKLLAEQYAVQANAWTFPQGTRVAALRFGNLLWSRGSVAHRWKNLVEAGKPIQLVAHGMTRYGVRLSAAGHTALTCALQLRGGEVFVPLLHAYRLEDLAEVVAPGAEIVVSGDRGPGEKKHETLWTEREAAHAVWWNNDIAVIEPEAPTWTRKRWTGKRVGGLAQTSEGATRRHDLALDELDDE